MNLDQSLPMEIENDFEIVCSTGRIHSVVSFCQMHQIHIPYRLGFYHACRHNCVSLAQWFYLQAPISLQLQQKCPVVFNMACSFGLMDIAQWLYDLPHPTIPKKHLLDRYCIGFGQFRSICFSGKIPFVQWSLSHLAHCPTFMEKKKWIQQVFPDVCMRGDLTMAKWMDQLLFPEFQPSIDLFQRCYRIGLVEMSKWIYSRCNLLLTRDDLITFCEEGIPTLIQWWYDEVKDTKCLDEVFQHACEKNNSLLADRIFSLLPDFDLTKNDDQFFTDVIHTNNVVMAEWFARVRPDRYEVVIHPIVSTGRFSSRFVGLEISSYLIKRMQMPRIIPNFAELCAICYDDANVESNCGHYFCQSCLSQWRCQHVNCPYCRQTINSISHIVTSPLN